MPDKKMILRDMVKADLGRIQKHLNKALLGKKLSGLEPIIEGLGRGGKVPHWYPKLKSDHTLPNLDGKTIGSVLEMLLVAVLETTTLKGKLRQSLHVNPARGIDLPDIDLGVKSPSTNYCTSEPFFSAYERLTGNEYDCLVLLTDYQEAKKNPPLHLQVTSARYLKGSQIADRKLCGYARQHREWLLRLGDAEARRAFAFLAYVNQSDWRARQLLNLMGNLQSGDDVISSAVKVIVDSAEAKNRRRKTEKGMIPDVEIAAIKKIVDSTPHHIGLLRALDNWVADFLKDAARLPNENEWNRMKTGPLDGMIGMSFALQWRYNFAYIFGGNEEEVDRAIQKCEEME